MMNNPAFRVLISLHDVMPETFQHVIQVLERLMNYKIPPIVLLVVPARDWKPDQIDRLRTWSENGYTLAAHGWKHEAIHIRRIYHKLHSRLISRNVAEHLAWEPGEIYPNMLRSIAWFREHNLPVPNFYVPPAWALGRIKFPFSMEGEKLAETRYPTHVEVLSGIMDTRTGQVQRLPLVGYEADALHRELFVRCWNKTQLWWAKRSGKPLRISLHPFDFDLRLAKDLDCLLCSPNLTPLEFSSWLADQ